MKNTFLDRLIRNIRTKEVVRLINKNSVVCDLGCDEGHFLIGIKERIKQGYGVDRRIEKRDVGNVSFISGDIQDKIPKVGANYITLLAVLEHLNEPEKVIMNSYRALKKGGRLILTTPAPRSKPVLEILAGLRVIDENEIKDHKHYFSPKEIFILLKKSGFNNIRIKKFELGFNILAIGQK